MGIEIKGGDANAGDGGDAQGGNVNADLTGVENTEMHAEANGLPPWFWYSVLAVVAIVGLAAGWWNMDQMLQLLSGAMGN